MAQPVLASAPLLDRAAARAPTLDDLPPYLMNRLVSRLNRNLEARLRRVGLSFAIWRVLAVLAASDGRSIMEMSDFTAIPHSTLSRLLDRMERTRLVRRRSASTDGRLVRIWLSAGGRAAYERALPHAVAESEGALVGFSSGERAEVARLLHRMLHNIGLTGPGEAIAAAAD